LSRARYEKVFIPHRAYWSTPFAKWQGSFATQHPIRLAAQVGKAALAERGISGDALESIVLGVTVPSRQSFWGAPWLATQLGLENITGPTISHACATSAVVVATAAAEVELGGGATLAIAADRTSNGPHLYYPDPTGPGGRGETEDWVWDNFNNDPNTHLAMVETAEAVAHESGITREEQDELTLRRYEQYFADRTPEASFRERYMVPVEVRDTSGRRVLATVTDDEGVFATTADGLARLKTTREGGTVTYGTQTHPADGNAGIVVSGRGAATDHGADGGITIQLLAYGSARARPGYMPQAPVPAARVALDAAGLAIEDMGAIKTHNPFVVNDLYLAREFDLDANSFNNHGSSLVYGHPQGPTGLRLFIELIEELVEKGGGHGLFTGCAAGDTGAALVVKVS